MQPPRRPGRPSGPNRRPRPPGARPRTSGANPRPAGGNPRPSGGNPRPSGGNQRPSGGNQRPSGGSRKPSGGSRRPPPARTGPAFARYDRVDLPDGLGTLGARLLRLEQAGLPVPPWFCLTVLHHRVGGLTPDERSGLQQQFDQLFGATIPVRVRPSPVDDDHEGLAEFTYVDREGLHEAVERCLASAQEPRVLFARRLVGNKEPFDAGVIVQRHVPAKASGTLRLRHPESNQCWIRAGWGEGAPRAADQDGFALERNTGMVLERFVAAKAWQRRLDDGEVVTAAVPPDARERPVLSDAELQRLARLGQDVHAAMPTTRLVDWLLDESGELYVLDARRAPDRDDEQSLVADATHAGPLTTLAASRVRRVTMGAARVALGLLGNDLEPLDRQPWLLEEPVQIRGGRVFHDVRAWHRLAKLHADEDVLRAWERLLGVPSWERTPAREKGFLERARKISRGRRSTRLKRPGEGLDGWLAEHAETDWSRLPARSLLEQAQALEGLLIKVAGAELAAEATAGPIELEVRDALGDAALSEHAVVATRAAVEGQGEAALDAFWEVAQAVGQQAGLVAAALGGQSPQVVWEALHAEPELTATGERVAAWFARYGGYPCREILLGREVRAHSRAERFCAALAVALEPEARLERIKTRCLTAREQAAQQGKAAAAQLKRLALQAQHVADRRQERVAGLTAWRRLHAALGQALLEDRALDAVDDVDWFSVDELAAIVQGRALCRDLRALAQLRRREHALHQRSPLAARQELHGPGYTAGLRAAR